MIAIRPMKREDGEAVLRMMRTFYDSPAVLHTASDDILRRDIEDCVGDCPLIDGWVFEDGGSLAGYAMTANSYSTEYGGRCVWIEDIYIRPKWRGQGIAGQFFAWLDDAVRETAVRLRLEVEAENAGAISVYKRCGYRPLPYIQMTKEQW